jgi:hypothetical protein
MAYSHSYPPILCCDPVLIAIAGNRALLATKRLPILTICHTCNQQWRRDTSTHVWSKADQETLPGFTLYESSPA